MSSHKGIFKNSELEEISSRLKFVGQLQPGQKISVGTRSIQDKSYWTSFVRTVTREDRKKVYQFISDVIQDSLGILDSLSNSSNEYDIQICKNIIIDLIYLNPGLTNLQETYKIDKMYVSKIETLKENLNVKVKELCARRKINYDELYEDAQKRIVVVQEEEEPDQSTVVDLVEEDTKEQVDEDDSQKKNTSSLDDAKAVIVTEESEDESDNQSEEEENKNDDDQEDTKNDDDQEEEEEDTQKENPLEKEQTTNDESKKPQQDSSSRNKRRRRRQQRQQGYQYSEYYMSTPEDITLCGPDLEKGLIRRK